MRRGGAAESLVTGVISAAFSSGFVLVAVGEVGFGLRRLGSGDVGADMVIE